MASQNLQSETLTGTVVAIIFQNPSNGFTILRVKTKGGSQTVVGEIGDISVGETITAAGAWVEHPTFGSQFKASAIEISIPTEADEICNYLSSVFKWKEVGAEKID